MTNFLLSLFSSVFHMNLKDPHDVPFALPLLFFIFLGFIISITVLKFIDVKEPEEGE